MNFVEYPDREMMMLDLADTGIRGLMAAQQEALDG